MYILSYLFAFGVAATSGYYAHKKQHGLAVYYGLSALIFSVMMAGLPSAS